MGIRELVFLTSHEDYGELAGMVSRHSTNLRLGFAFPGLLCFGDGRKTNGALGCDRTISILLGGWQYMNIQELITRVRQAEFINLGKARDALDRKSVFTLCASCHGFSTQQADVMFRTELCLVPL
jgi:hypothetical protein